MNRTEIYILLRRFRIDDPAYDEIADLTEQVMQGHLDWHDYVPRTRNLAERLRQV